ncbi:MAG TPA: hypothetical protein VD884_15090 [Ohtaekwangia sp.]|nr:hypothetical protein [Ohtaekwangia sp.]
MSTDEVPNPDCYNWSYFDISPISLACHFYNRGLAGLEQYAVLRDSHRYLCPGYNRPYLLNDVRKLVHSYYLQLNSWLRTDQIVFLQIIKDGLWQGPLLYGFVSMDRDGMENESNHLSIARTNGDKVFLEMYQGVKSKLEKSNLFILDEGPNKDSQLDGKIRSLLDTEILGEDRCLYVHFFAMKLGLVGSGELSQFLLLNLMKGFGGKFHAFKYFLKMRLLNDKEISRNLNSDRRDLTFSWLDRFEVNSVNLCVGRVIVLSAESMIAEIFNALKDEFEEDDHLRLLELIERKSIPEPIFFKKSARLLVTMFKLLRDAGLFVVPDLRKFITSNFCYYDAKKRTVCKICLATVKVYLARPKYIQSHPVKKLVAKFKTS